MAKSGRKFGHPVSEETRAKISKACRKYTLNENFFESIDTPEKAYILGFLLTDGNVNSKRGSITITLSAIDLEHLRRIAKEMGSNSEIKVERSSGRNGRKVADYASLRIYSTKMIKDLGKYGMIDNKTFSVKRPDLPDSLMPDFWRGCVDGDGWVESRGVIGLCGTKDLVESFREYIRPLVGSEANVYSVGNIWAIQYNGSRVSPKVVGVLGYDENRLSLPRKLEKALDILKLEPKRKSYADITQESVANLYSDLGSWTKVAEKLGMKYEGLYQLRKQRGWL